MNTETALPDEVIAEIEANRKVTAIKLLRKQRSIGLKEAKEMVEAYIDDRPSTSTAQPPKTDTGLGRILVLIIGVSVIYGIYKLLA